MKLVNFIILIRKHIALLILVPVFLVVLVIGLTVKPHFNYSSQTVLYTGLATGSSIEMDKTFNYFVNNTAFDNLINIVNSRETQEAVAIRLLAEHLMLDSLETPFVTAKTMNGLRKITPKYIYQYVVKSNMPSTYRDTLANKYGGSDSADIDARRKKNIFPAQINRDDFDATVQKLTLLMKSSDTNFVYKLLNYEDPH